jgi:6-phosphogluconolactonase
MKICARLFCGAAYNFSMKLLHDICIRSVLIFCAMIAILQARGAKPHGELTVYFGTTARAAGQGIYFSRFDLRTGKLSEPELAAEIKNPSFLAIHPNKHFLYSVGESNSVNAFEIDSNSGQLKFLNRESSGGKGPTHLIVDKKGKAVLVANYGGGSVSVLPIQKNGSLGALTAFIQHTGSSVNPKRQTHPYAHSVNLSPDNRFAFVADLGLDKMMIYRFDSRKISLATNEPAFAIVPPGSGPRHSAFHPNGRILYVVNEMGCSVTVFNYDAKRGALTELQTISALPPGEKLREAFTGAEIAVHPSGKFVFASIRGHDSIAIFNVDPKSGKLNYVESQSTEGKTPRNFGMDPTGKFLLAANQDSNTVVVFKIDSQTGRLERTGQVLEIPAPVCVEFLKP